MKSEKRKYNFREPTQLATITLLVKNEKVLLAMKKRGFGVGKWNGVGGKQNPDEDIQTTAIRESKEEISVTPTVLKKVAILNFHFPFMPIDKRWDQQVHVFISTKWQGKPVETEEMKPQWFEFKDIPYKEMWPDEKIWMPKVLNEKLLTGNFIFDEKENISEYQMKEVENL